MRFIRKTEQSEIPVNVMLRRCSFFLIAIAFIILPVREDNAYGQSGRTLEQNHPLFTVTQKNGNVVRAIHLEFFEGSLTLKTETGTISIRIDSIDSIKPDLSSLRNMEKRLGEMQSLLEKADLTTKKNISGSLYLEKTIKSLQEQIKLRDEKIKQVDEQLSLSDAKVRDLSFQLTQLEFDSEILRQKTNEVQNLRDTVETQRQEIAAKKAAISEMISSSEDLTVDIRRDPDSAYPPSTWSSSIPENSSPPSVVFALASLCEGEGLFDSGKYSRDQQSLIFSRKFKNKVFLVSGEITDIGEDFSGRKYITLLPVSGHFFDVYPNGKFDLLDYEKGKIATFKGRWTVFGTGVLVSHRIEAAHEVK